MAMGLYAGLQPNFSNVKYLDSSTFLINWSLIRAQVWLYSFLSITDSCRVLVSYCRKYSYVRQVLVRGLVGNSVIGQANIMNVERV